MILSTLDINSWFFLEAQKMARVIGDFIPKFLYSHNLSLYANELI